MAVEYIDVNGNLVATDVVDGKHYQLIKLGFGADDAVAVVADSDGQRLPVKATITGLTEALPAGTNLIGIVQVSSLPELPVGDNLIGQVDINEFPASARSTDTVGATPDVNMANGLTLLTTKFAVINRATSGDATVVAAVSGKKIRVLSYDLVCAGAVTVTWKSGATAISGAKSYAANGGLVKSHPQGVMETASGQALVLTLSGAVQVSGELSYVEV